MFTTPHSPTAAQACSVIHAGPDVMLTLLDRPGRFPIEITLLQAPLIGWRAQDGKEEFIEFAGPHGLTDHAQIKEQLEGDGLLVAAIADLGTDNLQDATPWLVHSTAERQRESERAA